MDQGLMCSACGKSFQSRSSLSNHESRHSETAPHRCCGKLFYSMANLTRHRCRKHGAEKKYKCTVCDKFFSLACDLRLHEKDHNENSTLKCDLCDFSTKHKHIMTDHVYSHQGRREHVCACGKTFIYRSNLNRHKKKCKNST